MESVGWGLVWGQLGTEPWLTRREFGNELQLKVLGCVCTCGVGLLLYEAAVWGIVSC